MSETIGIVGALLVVIILIQQIQIGKLQKATRWLVSHTRLSNDEEIGEEADELMDYIMNKED